MSETGRFIRFFFAEKKFRKKMNKNTFRCIFRGEMKIVSRLCSGFVIRDRIANSRRRLYKVALAWTGDQMLADDLVQETMAIGLQKSHQLRDQEKLNAWLYSILHNCWRRSLRQNQPDLELDLEEMPSEANTEVQTDRVHVVQFVREAVYRLPVGQREVISLVDLEGFSYSEVSEILEIPIGTVMSRLNRARKTLQKSLLCLHPDSRKAVPRLRRVQ